MEYTPGAVLWTELMTSDIPGACAFYAATAGWTFSEVEMGVGPYVIAKSGDEMVAGLMAMPEEMAGVPPYWVSYIGVADVDAVARAAEAAGAVIHQPPFEVAGVGRMVILQDPQGAQIAYMTPSG